MFCSIFKMMWRPATWSRQQETAASPQPTSTGRLCQVEAPAVAFDLFVLQRKATVHFIGGETWISFSWQCMWTSVLTWTLSQSRIRVHIKPPMCASQQSLRWGVGVKRCEKIRMSTCDQQSSFGVPSFCDPESVNGQRIECHNATGNARISGVDTAPNKLSLTNCWKPDFIPSQQQLVRTQETHVHVFLKKLWFLVFQRYCLHLGSSWKPQTAFLPIFQQKEQLLVNCRVSESRIQKQIFPFWPPLVLLSPQTWQRACACCVDLLVLLPKTKGKGFGLNTQKFQYFQKKFSRCFSICSFKLFNGGHAKSKGWFVSTAQKRWMAGMVQKRLVQESKGTWQWKPPARALNPEPDMRFVGGESANWQRESKILWR